MGQNDGFSKRKHGTEKGEKWGLFPLKLFPVLGLFLLKKTLEAEIKTPLRALTQEGHNTPETGWLRWWRGGKA